MKRLPIILFAFLIFQGCNIQNNKKDSKPIFENDLDRYSAYFSEVEDLLNKDKGDFWGVNLYGPVLLVNPKTREIVANEGDSAGVLTQKNGLFTGILPPDIFPSNTAMNWNKKRWTMIMTPLPTDENYRISLFAHELFHRIQPELGFEATQGDNKHLDEKEGRILLKLELEALVKAIESENSWKAHIANAMKFRLRRYEIYTDAKQNENLLEINEGIAEYTGSKFGFREDEELKAHFLKRIATFEENPTFVRSFAYETIPVYGFFYSKSNNQWHREISQETNLTNYFIKGFGISTSDNLEQELFEIREEYDYNNIYEKEEIRENERLELIKSYKEKLLSESALVLNSYNMNIQFDPRNIMPLEDFGTVYPQLQVSDEWGILETEKGGLISPAWNKITVSEPLIITDTLINGDGWELKLNPDWKVEKTGNKYQLKKK